MRQDLDGKEKPVKPMAEHPQVKASLGCGTLLLIAIIVLVFGGHNDHKKLEEKIDALQKEVQELRGELKGEKPAKSELE